MFKITYRILNNLKCVILIVSIAFLALLLLILWDIAFTLNFPYNVLFACLAFGTGLLIASLSICLKRRIVMRLKRKRLGQLEDPIPANHGSNLAELFLNLQGEKFECQAFFTKDGKKFCEITMKDPERITVPLWCPYGSHKNKDRHISVHNHPGKDIIPFSINDIIAAIYSKELCSVVVTVNYCFVMEYPRALSSHEVKQVNRFLKTFKASGNAPSIIYLPEDDFVKFDIRNDRLKALSRCVALAENFGFNFWMSSAEKCADILLARLREY